MSQKRVKRNYRLREVTQFELFDAYKYCKPVELYCEKYQIVKIRRTQHKNEFKLILSNGELHSIWYILIQDTLNTITRTERT